MKRLSWVALVAAVPIIAAAVVLTTRGAGGTTAATAVLRNASGVQSGAVQVVFGQGAAQVVANVTLPAGAGFHGFHLHSKGVCDPASVDPATGQVVPFFSAGGHVGGGAGGQAHAGHDGDLPSLLVNGDGTATVTVKTDRATMAKLLDADGSAVIVHAGPDNFANIPTRYAAGGADTTTLNTGDSGGRALCGVLR